MLLESGTMSLKEIVRSLKLEWLFEENLLLKLGYSDCRILPLKGKGFETGFCLGEYSYDNSGRTALGKLIYNFKYKSNQDAGKILAGLVSQLIKEKFGQSQILVSVPPSFTSRVFQPISFLAEGVSFKTGISWEKDILGRTRLCQCQKELRSHWEKRKNVSDLFKLNQPKSVRDKMVLLLDDIYDSGATLAEICRVLRLSGAYNIGAVTLAKTGFEHYGLP